MDGGLTDPGQGQVPELGQPGLRPRFRTDLLANPAEEEGVSYVDVIDPNTGASFRFYDFEYAIAREMDGERTLAEISAWAKARFGFETTPVELTGYASKLEELGYLLSGGPIAAGLAAPGLASKPPALAGGNGETAAGDTERAVRLAPPVGTAGGSQASATRYPDSVPPPSAAPPPPPPAALANTTETDGLELGTPGVSDAPPSTPLRSQQLTPAQVELGPTEAAERLSKPPPIDTAGVEEEVGLEVSDKLIVGSAASMPAGGSAAADDEEIVPASGSISSGAPPVPAEDPATATSLGGGEVSGAAALRDGSPAPLVKATPPALPPSEVLDAEDVTDEDVAVDETVEPADASALVIKEVPDEQAAMAALAQSMPAPAPAKARPPVRARKRAPWIWLGGAVVLACGAAAVLLLHPELTGGPTSTDRPQVKAEPAPGAASQPLAAPEPAVPQAPKVPALAALAPPAPVEAGAGAVLSFSAGGKLAQLAAAGTDVAPHEVIAALVGIEPIEKAEQSQADRAKYYAGKLELAQRAHNQAEIQRDTAKVAEHDQAVAALHAKADALRLVAGDEPAHVEKVLVRPGATVAAGAPVVELAGGPPAVTFTLTAVPPPDLTAGGACTVRRTATPSALIAATVKSVEGNQVVCTGFADGSLKPGEAVELVHEAR